MGNKVKEEIPENLGTLFSFTMADPELRSLFITKAREHLPNIFAQEASEELLDSAVKVRAPKKKDKDAKIAPKKSAKKELRDLGQLRELILSTLKSGPKKTTEIKEAIGAEVDTHAFQNAMTYLKGNEQVVGKKIRGSNRKTWELKK